MTEEMTTEWDEICPFISDSRGFVLCQKEKCAASYPTNLIGEVFWICELIEGHPSKKVIE